MQEIQSLMKNYFFFLIAFIIPSIIWDQLLEQPVLSEYQTVHGEVHRTNLINPEGELNSKV